MGFTQSVESGQLVQSAWGNEIRDRTCQVFANAAERDSQWADPPIGAFCVTLDNGVVYQRGATAWQTLTAVAKHSMLRKNVVIAGGAFAYPTPPAVPGWWTIGGAPQVLTIQRAGIYDFYLNSVNSTGANPRGVINIASAPTYPSSHLSGATISTVSTVTVHVTGIWCKVNDQVQYRLMNEAGGSSNFTTTATCHYHPADVGPIDGA